VANVELVVKLPMCTSVFTFNVEVHESVQQMLRGEWQRVEHIAQDAPREVSVGPNTMVQDRSEPRFEARILDVFRTAEESNAEHDDLVALRGANDVRNDAGDVFEVVDNILDEVFR